MDVKKMLDNLKVAAIASDPDFNITYINKRGEELSKAIMNADNLVGSNMRVCHKPKTNEKLEKLIQEYHNHERSLDYYVMDNPGMSSPQANFGEDMQTIRVTETPPAGTYTQSWHSKPQTVVYGGHIGKDGENYQADWGPYEHLHPAQWESTLGEDYRRCCTSVSWIGEALAARLIPGIQAAWSHPQFFDYADRWMNVADDPADLAVINTAWGTMYDQDFQQGQSWRILSGGGYHAAWRTFVDEMWTVYRNYWIDRPPAPANLRLASP